MHGVVPGGGLARTVAGLARDTDGADGEAAELAALGDRAHHSLPASAPRGDLEELRHVLGQGLTLLVELAPGEEPRTSKVHHSPSDLVDALEAAPNLLGQGAAATEHQIVGVLPVRALASLVVRSEGEVLASAVESRGLHVQKGLSQPPLEQKGEGAEAGEAAAKHHPRLQNLSLHLSISTLLLPYARLCLGVLQLGPPPSSRLVLTLFFSCAGSSSVVGYNWS
mmetsp:Transcript_8073/g.24167  ORF Transcript_8073/g.24167 Transcript_8073/m.24167 type:complete len:224 (-) Transcript_8073:2-673(-)